MKKILFAAAALLSALPALGQSSAPSPQFNRLKLQIPLEAEYGGLGTVNVNRLGAKPDARQIATIATIAASSAVLTTADALWSSADVGKTIGIEGAGATPATGRITATAVASAGSDYQASPTIAYAGGTPTTAAAPVAVVGVVSVTQTSAGAGCPDGAGGADLSMQGAPDIVPRVTATISGGVMTAVSLTNSGQWQGTFPTSGGSPALTAIPVVVTGCTTYPQVSVSMGLVAVGYGSAYYGAGYGAGYPTTGMTASLSGGSPSVAATLGAVTVTPFVSPLVATIVSVQSATQVTLSAPASTARAAVATNLTWGTLSTTAVQAAVDAGTTVRFAPGPGCYLVGKITLPSNRTLYGERACIMLAPNSYDPMFAGTGVTGIEAYGLTLIGNLSTFVTSATGSGAFSFTSSSDINLHHMNIRSFGRHCIAGTSLTNVKVTDNTISGCFFGAGINLASGTTPSVNVIVSRNHVSATQWAGVTVVPMDGGVISDNVLIGSNAGYGDSTGGNVQDCLTGYSDSPTHRNAVISGNVLRDCGNNGIHWGGDAALIARNTIDNAKLFCLLFGRAPNSAPVQSYDVTITGNQCRGWSTSNPNRSSGYSIRNVTGGAVTGNLATNVYTAFELNGFAGTPGLRNISVSGNIATTVFRGIWAVQKVQYSAIFGNSISASRSNCIEFSNSIQYSGQSYGDYYNDVGVNVLDNCAGAAVADGGTGGYNRVAPQMIVNSPSGGGAVTMTASTSTAEPQRAAVTIATLPACATGSRGWVMVITNGQSYAAAAYGVAVGSTTGAATRRVACDTTAWVYN